MMKQLISWKKGGVFVMMIILIGGCQKDMNLEPGENKISSFAKFQEVMADEYIIVFSPQYADQVKNQYIPNRNLKQKQRVVQSEAAEVLQNYNIAPENIIATYGVVLVGLTARLSPQQLDQLEDDPRISYIEPNQIYELEQAVSPKINHHRDWHDRGGDDDDGSEDPQQTTPWGVARVGYTTYTGSNRAWVLDTGIDLDHEDLSLAGADCNGGSCSFVTWGPGQDSPDDDHGHGTHVGGTIGAIDNSVGVVGVAAGIELVAVKVFTKFGSAKLSDILNGIDYIGAHAKENDVTNMSFGGGKSQSLDDATIALADKKVYISVAAGNSSDDADNYSPARTGNMHAYIYTIAAMEEGDAWASFSNYGDPVSYISPGVNILSTTPNNNYDEYSGTSMSAPHIGGILLVKNGAIEEDGTVQGPDKLYPIGHTGIGILALVNTRYQEMHIPDYHAMLQ